MMKIVTMTMNSDDNDDLYGGGHNLDIYNGVFDGVDDEKDDADDNAAAAADI